MNTLNKPIEKKPKKLHVKHVDVGFLYAPKSDTKDLRMVVEIRDTDARHCKIYFVTQMKYSDGYCVRQAIVDGIRKGTLVCMTGDEYR